jgi:outer membrane protease
MKILLIWLFFTKLLFSKSIETNLILTSGCANEYVNHDSGKTLSKLAWKYENITLINLNLSYPILKSNNINLLLKYSRNIISGTNSMTDSDWLDENSNKISKYGYHSKTNLNNLEKIDLSLVKYINSNFFIKLGYKSHFYDWTAFGGDYSYMDSVNNDIKVISYTQNIKMPYASVGINTKNKDFIYQSELGYSNKVKIDTLDTHYLKNRSYYDYFKNGKSYFVSFKIAYIYNKKIEYFISYFYEKFYKINGYNITKDTLSNQVLSRSKEDFVSTSHSNDNYTFGLKFNF